MQRIIAAVSQITRQPSLLTIHACGGHRSSWFLCSYRKLLTLIREIYINSSVQHTQVDDDSETHLTLFDTGPDSNTITRNLAALQIPTERINRVILSHWHADHSGGILAFLRARNKATLLDDITRQSSQTGDRPGDLGPCVFDLHPDRPLARGIAPGGKVIARLPDDPTFEQIEELGGVVEKHNEGHVVANGTIYVSGQIPRVTGFEQGLLGAVRWKGQWVPEEVGSLTCCRLQTYH